MQYCERARKCLDISLFLGMPVLSIGHLRDCATKGKMNMKCFLLVLNGGSDNFSLLNPLGKNCPIFKLERRLLEGLLCYLLRCILEFAENGSGRKSNPDQRARARVW